MTNFPLVPLSHAHKHTHTHTGATLLTEVAVMAVRTADPTITLLLSAQPFY